MKVIAINGSPRKGGNTEIVLKAMAVELQKEKIDTEIIQVGNQRLHGCTACEYCASSEKNHCVFKDDILNEVSDKIRAADGFILGSPTYYAGIAGTMKCFLDRLFYSSGGYFKCKVAAPVAVTRRAGSIEVLDQLTHYLRLAQTVIPPSQYWATVYGAEKGEVLQDGEGMQTIRKNARAMAWLMKSLKDGEGHVPPYVDEERVMTNFIR